MLYATPVFLIHSLMWVAPVINRQFPQARQVIDILAWLVLLFFEWEHSNIPAYFPNKLKAFIFLKIHIQTIIKIVHFNLRKVTFLKAYREGINECFVITFVPVESRCAWPLFRDLKPRNRRASGRKAATPSVKMGLVSGEGTLQPEDKLNLPFQPASIPTLCHRFIANISPLL